MFKVKEELNVIIIEIDGINMCWFHADYGVKDFRKKIGELTERGLKEL